MSDPSGGGDHAARVPSFRRVDGADGDRAPVLVMVHGATQDRRVFDAQARVFARRFRLVLIDLPGHGESFAMPGPYDFERYAAAVDAALTAAAVRRFHYWATHTGAGVGLMLLERMPARIESAVLEGVVLPNDPPPSVRAAHASACEVARRDGVAAARAHWFSTAPWFAVMRRAPVRCRAAAYRALLDDFHGAPWLDDRAPRRQRFDLDAAAASGRPVLLINGSEDVPDFLEVADRVGARLSCAQAERIDAAGGFPLWERPRAVAAAVLRFLDAVAS